MRNARVIAEPSQDLHNEQDNTATAMIPWLPNIELLKLVLVVRGIGIKTYIAVIFILAKHSGISVPSPFYNIE